jgi:hypothetical protein
MDMRKEPIDERPTVEIAIKSFEHPGRERIEIIISGADAATRSMTKKQIVQGIQEILGEAPR